MFLLCNQAPIQDSIFIKVLPAIISALVVFLLFIVGRLIDSSIRNKEINRSWYLRVVVEPNLKKVEDFMNNSLSSISNSVTTLVAIKDNNASTEDYFKAKSGEIGKFQSLKRNFEINFIELVQVNYPETGLKLSESLRELEDIVSSCLDSKDLTHDNYLKLESAVTGFRNFIFFTLYQPISRNKFRQKVKQSKQKK